MKLRNKIIKRLADGNKWEAMYTDNSKTGNASVIKTWLYIISRNNAKCTNKRSII